MHGKMFNAMLWLALCLLCQVHAFISLPYPYCITRDDRCSKFKEQSNHSRQHGFDMKSCATVKAILRSSSISVSKTTLQVGSSKENETKKKISKKKKVTRAKSSASKTTRIPVAGIKKKKRKVTTKQKRGRKKKSIRKKKTSKVKKQEEDPIHFWRNETDVITIEYFNHSSTSTSDVENIYGGENESQEQGEKSLHFLVRGNPVPLARHRSYRGFIFNPSAKKQQQFCSVVLDMLPLSHFDNTNATETASPSTDVNLLKTSENVIPFFHSDEALSVNIICRMKRPMIHFVASKPGPGRLRQSSMSRLQITRQDVDNLAKFVLDSLNGVLYVDDRQIASLQIAKIYDDDEDRLWKGSTEVKIRKLSEEDMHDFSI